MPFFQIDVKIFTETACPTCRIWFEKFIRGSNLRMVVIKKQDFRVTRKMVTALFFGWTTEWKRVVLNSKREISCLEVTVEIGVCGGLRGEELFLPLLKVMLIFWWEKRLNW